MKSGDLVTVKDCHGYNAYMQNLVGHIGIVLDIGRIATKVFILDQIRYLNPNDLEILNESQ
tara:strand:+ start:717 stop:899 length:183 start_codon:yes stop_codon:yes gene_type:complete